MSELKAYRIKGNTLGDFDDVYIKSEADKVIAELEESHKMEVEQLLIEIAELKKKLTAAQLAQRLNEPEALYSNLDTMNRLSHEIDVVARRERHHKYKRCLAMAKWCKLWYEEEKYEWQLKDIHHWFKTSLFDKWHKRWLKIAESFKEAK